MLAIPDVTAGTVSLWRAAHAQLDPPPHVFIDEIGPRLVAGAGGLWADVGAAGSAAMRGVFVARARFTEDLVAQAASGAARCQYVILGAGADTFAQRTAGQWPELRVFEVDREAMTAWKRERLLALGLASEQLVLVPHDFERDGSWLEALVTCGLDPAVPTVVSALGLSQYVTEEALSGVLRQVASLGHGSSVVVTFALPPVTVQPQDRPTLARVVEGAQAQGVPWISFYTPGKITALARASGLRDPQVFSSDQLTQRYFADRTDGLRVTSMAGLLTARS